MKMGDGLATIVSLVDHQAVSAGQTFLLGDKAGSIENSLVVAFHRDFG